MLVHTATWLINLNCFPYVVQCNKAVFLAEWGRVTAKCWKGTFQVLLSWTFAVSITGCRKFLSLIPVLLFVVVDECEVTLNPDMSEWPEADSETAKCSQLTLITLISAEKKTTSSAESISCFLPQDLGENLNQLFPAAQLVSLKCLCVT